MAPLRARPAAEAVRGRVVRVVGLDLDDHAADAVDDELGPDQLGRDLVHGPVEEVGPERRSPAGQSARRRLRRGSPARSSSTRAGGGRGGRGRRRRSGPARPRRRRAGRDRARRRGSGSPSAAGFAPIAATIARSVRDATIGSAIPSTQTRVRAPCPRSPVGERLERVDLVGADVLAEAEEDHPLRAVGHPAIIPETRAGGSVRRASRGARRRPAPDPRAAGARGTGSPSCARSRPR